MHVTAGILSSFITLLVTIGPIETAVVFAGLTTGIHRSERISLAARSVTIASGVLLLFAVAGGTVPWLAMLAADRLVLLLGSTGADVVGRISGVLLAGLAVQFIFDGLAAAPFLAG